MLVNVNMKEMTNFIDLIDQNCFHHIMSKRSVECDKTSSAKKEKLAGSDTDQNVKSENKQIKFNEDKDNILDCLMEAMIKKCNYQITEQMIVFRSVNVKWKEAFDRLLQNTAELTIEIVLDDPVNSEDCNQDSDKNCSENSKKSSQLDLKSSSSEELNDSAEKSTILDHKQMMHVNNIASEFNRLSLLGKDDVAFERKGILIRAKAELLHTFVSFMKTLVKNQTTLSLAVTDNFRQERRDDSLDASFFKGKSVHII